ncbi:MAG TPA: [LysW]-lysine hydrolase [Candidatus Limnocylindria bacterium]|nr:[LysW]-lysine hydrolase [Candidatus Limnocylindria bacterium]
MDPDVELVRGLVAIPSTSRNEGEAVEWLVARMAERGFRVSVDDAGNAVGEIGDGPAHVVLLGHIDTVPGEIPVRIEDGELVGRGAVDAKGPLAAFVAAATRPPAGVRVTVVGAVEEESPTSAGARHRATLAAPDWCVIGEPSGWDAVTVAYKGRLALRIALSRASRHGAAPGPTCTEEALALWSRVRASAERRTSGADGFARLDCRLEGMSGGVSDGLIERAELRVGYRIPPGIATRELEDEVRAIVAAHDGDAKVTIERVAAEEPARTPRTTPLARAFVGAIAAAGGEATFKVKSGTSDMNILAPAWACPMVAYGPGDSKYDHTPMERLRLSDYERSIRVLRHVLARAGKPII